jgi:hypothetical protein
MVVSKIGMWNVDWIHLAQNLDQWQTLVNMAMYLEVP